MSRVCAVIVTRNRLKLLQSCLAALDAQTRRPDGVIVVDNASNDGTGPWLDARRGVKVIRQENTGAAGGFFTGLKTACESGYDWMWTMDDDCEALPGALETLLASRFMDDEEVGFLVGLALNGEGRLPYVPFFQQLLTGPTFLEWIDAGSCPMLNCGYPSLLVRRAAIEKSGLPRRAYFLGYDDLEFTARIVHRGFRGHCLWASRMIHRSSGPFDQDLRGVTPANAWRYALAVRNKIHWLRSLPWTPWVRWRTIAGYWARDVLPVIATRPPAVGWRLLRASLAGLTFEAPVEFPDRPKNSPDLP